MNKEIALSGLPEECLAAYGAGEGVTGFLDEGAWFGEG